MRTARLRHNHAWFYSQHQMSLLRAEGGQSFKFEQISCTVRSNASWVMVPWGPLYGQNDGQTWLKTLPSRNFVGER